VTFRAKTAYNYTMDFNEKKRVAVLVSGGGTNLEALLKAERENPERHSKIVLVVSSSKDAFALQRAKNYHVESLVLPKSDFISNKIFDEARYDAALLGVLLERKIDFVVLAGFLVILGKEVLETYQNRIINIHPSLLPAFGGKDFYGLKVHHKALEAGVKVTGATVHLVNGDIDGGRILLQKAVDVLPGDTPETLQKRVMEEAEWLLLPRALELLCTGEALSEGKIKGGGAGESGKRVAVIGSGGREHCIIKKLKESKRISKLYCIPGNAGMAKDAEIVDINATDLKGVVDFCMANRIDYVVVAPDDPLALGMVDELRVAGIPSFGPDKKAARIESSKVFSKELMRQNGIPTAAFAVFDNAASARSYIKEYFNAGGGTGGGGIAGEGTAGGGTPSGGTGGATGIESRKIVIKADGLALGKGVLICDGEAEALNAIKIIMEDKKFGKAGEKIIIEEHLEGVEVSILSFCDGETVVPMVSSMDHKRALDGDRGLNTGGMGTIAPNPYWTKEIEAPAMEKIFLPTIKAMKSLGSPFSGCLYFGLMLTKNGPYVIEYNCRFGDPETQVVLPLLEGDLFEIMLATTNGTLARTDVHFSTQRAACVVMASGGYPESYETGFEITGIEDAESEAGVTVYCAGVKSGVSSCAGGGRILTSGGRVLGITALASTLDSALAKAYSAVKKITFKGAHYRNDIGHAVYRSLKSPFAKTGAAKIGDCDKIGFLL